MLAVRDLLFPLVILLCAAVGHSSPLQRRQDDQGFGTPQGSPQCNLNRIRVLVGLQEAIDAVDALSTHLADPSFVPNVVTAQNGIHGAQLTTNTILTAVFTRQPIDPDLTNQFSGNLTLSANALQGIVTTDLTANTTLLLALDLLAVVAEAQGLEVQDCVHT